jgi:beta-phosphoglucomutase
MSVRAVLFDVDGTMVDNHEAHEASWMVWAARHHHTLDHAYYREHLYARSNDRILRTLLGDSITAEEIERWAAEKEAIYRDLYRPKMMEMPGLSALLNQLVAAGIACGVASNAERVNVDFVVDGLGLREKLGAVLAREDVQAGKPDPELFLLAARRLDCAPGDCLVFEDSGAGFEAAHRAGMICYAITGHSRSGAIPASVVDVHRDFTTVHVRDLVRR